MPWLLQSPEHQHIWYWLCRTGKFLSYLRKAFNYLMKSNVDICFVSLKNFACIGLNTSPWVIHGASMGLSSSPPGQNVLHCLDNIFKWFFFNEKFCISIQTSLKCDPKGPIENKSALVQVMVWHWGGTKPLPELIYTQFTTHVCSTTERLVNHTLVSVGDISARNGTRVTTSQLLVCWELWKVVVQSKGFNLQRKFSYQSCGLTHCGLMMPYGNMELSQHWFR